MDILSGFTVSSESLNTLFGMFMALICGAIMSTSYCFANTKKRFSISFIVTILLLPVVMSVIIPYVATDLKKTLSLAGVFALIRFRSIPGDAKDLLFMFFAAAAGLVIGLHDYFVGFSLVIFVSILFVLIFRFWKTSNNQILKITIPEDMDYKGVFDSVFSKNLQSWKIKNVKTSNMGSLFVLSYWILPKNDINEKAFLDEIRVLNGNLTVSLENPDDQNAPVL